MSEAGDSAERLIYLKQLALSSLHAFSGGFADLERVVRDLKSVLPALEGLAGSACVEALRRQWGQLEIIYALALDDERYSLAPEEEVSASEAVAHLLREFEGEC